MDEEERNFFFLMLLLSREGLQKLRLSFIKEWNSAGGFVPWTDCPQNGSDLLTKFKPRPYEVSKVKSGDSTKWDLSLLVKALINTRPPLVPSSNKALFDALKCLKEIRDKLCYTGSGRIASAEFQVLYKDLCNALRLLGVSSSDIKKVKEDVKQLPWSGVLDYVKQYTSQENEILQGLRNAVRIPPEIVVQGDHAKESYQRALDFGKVEVYRACVMIVGQDRAGKTSLKRSLLGMPFVHNLPSTVGVEVMPCTATHDEIKNWQTTESKRVIDNNGIASFIAKDMDKQETNSMTNIMESDERNKAIEIASDVHEQEVNKEPTNLPQSAHSTESTKYSHMPEDIKASLIAHLKEKEIGETIKAKEYTINIWDFAGQQLYYASHPVFMSHRAVYILVYNLEKDLCAKAEPRVRQGSFDVILDNASSETNLDNLLSWLVSVHCLSQHMTDNLDETEGQRKYKRPPVIIVGTHADGSTEGKTRVETMEKEIKIAIRRCGFQDHVLSPYFAVNNENSSDDAGVQSLRSKISEVFKQEPYVPETVPIRWFHFEKVLELVKEKKINFMAVQKLREIAEEVCTIDHTEISSMLKFYHLLGIIIMYDDIVVLDTKWLIDLFKGLITIKPHDEQEPKLRKCWEELEKSGKLSTYLVDHVFHKHLNCNHSPSKCECQAKKDILALMEHFGLIAELAQHNPEKDYPYLVPSHLTSDEEEPEESLSKLAPCPLYICFSGGYIPHGLYVRLICKWCSIYGFKKPKLYRNAAKFVVNSDSRIIMRVKCCKSFIQIRLHSEQKGETCVDFKALEIKDLIKDSLASLLNKCSWYSCLKYELCVSCPLCAVKSTGAGKKEGFDIDDCLHPISDDDGLYCEDKQQWPEVQGLQHWCPRATRCSSMTDSKASSGVLSLTGNNKRWVVVGIALMEFLLPTLREFIASNITKHYSSLKTMKNIDTQCYGPHLFDKDGTFQLNYTSINNNKGKKEHYDYKVKSPVDLAKLYLKPYMAKFTGIDATCDLSAVLGILSAASVFTHGTQDAASKV